MADLPQGFWSGWIAVVTLTSFAGLAWLVMSIYSRPAEPHGPADEPVWDGDLREGSSPAPLWWFWLILAAMVFSVVYLMLYPGLGSYAGAFRWSQGAQIAEHTEDYREEFAAARSELSGKSPAELAADPDAMRTARRLFLDNCSACHGRDARGQAQLFPDLRDADWQWGGSAEQIEQTIRNGRKAVMIPWQAVLGDEGVANVAGYVRLLASGEAQGHAGATQYLQLCVACHGPSGDGNPALGAPRLNDAQWLYGGDEASVRMSIAQGRSGEMPAFGNKLDDLQIRLLIAWLMAPPAFHDTPQALQDTPRTP
ncbi:MAG: cytochrome-c oxidase, cbb3-type subunit III [Pseudomonadota bacterium]|nr:cytochrome-c oxidase, cbb3-type subunit III [Pseudomonadota bacterium]